MILITYILNLDINSTNKIVRRYVIDERDGYYDLFGVDKTPNMQSIIFDHLGYSAPVRTNRCNSVIQELEAKDNDKYAEYLNRYYWNTIQVGQDIEINLKPKLHQTTKNVFVLVNEFETTKNIVIEKLTEAGEDVDLVIMPLADTIIKPGVDGITSQSKEAYQMCIDKVLECFVFN